MMQFETKEALFEHLRANKSILKAEKMASMKMADAISFIEIAPSANSDARKAVNDIGGEGDITVSCVINTTNILDSHNDVHMPGLWKKSISEMKNMWLIKEHNFNFDNVISDNVQVSTRNMPWSAVGANYEGKTQALVFTAVISPNDKTGMYRRYKEGRVPNHSVGMRYIKVELCINSDDPRDAIEKTAWDKYIGEVVNPQGVEYFWAVTEAKLIEGSAVLMGSNPITPVIGIKNSEEPAKATPEQIEPPKALDNIFTRTANFIN
jgi:hypothetical protein